MLSWELNSRSLDYKSDALSTELFWFCPCLVFNVTFLASRNRVNPSSCQYPLINYRNLDDDIDDHQTILARSLEELQHKLNRMEQELIIVGEESKELQLRLGQREDDLTKKVRFKGPYFNYVSICLPIFDQVCTLR